jgi:hypothetical protein
MSPIRFFVVQTSAIASKGLTSTTTVTKIEAGAIGTPKFSCHANDKLFARNLS